MFSCVFLMSHFEMIELTMCLKGFRHAHAAAARMCLACHFLQGIMALAGAQTLLKQFEERAKVAREAPIDRNVAKLFFNFLIFLKKGFSMLAEGNVSSVLGEKIICFFFICFLDVAS